MPVPDGCVRPHPDGVLVAVWVVPGAARDEVTGFYGGALRVRVSAPPEGGKASRAAAALAAQTVGGRSGAVVAGNTSRRKEVVVSGVSAPAARRRLEALFAEG